MEDKIKIFSVRGEFRMSEDDTFKSAKNFAYDSAMKILAEEVANFLSSSAKNFNIELDEDDIVEISNKFLKVDDPHYIRELLNGDDMICYAEIKAEINIGNLTDFLKNFHVFELEKKIFVLEKIIEEKDKIIAELKNSSDKKISTDIINSQAKEMIDKIKRQLHKRKK